MEREIIKDLIKWKNSKNRNNLKNQKQQELIERYAAVRQELKAKGDYIGLSKLPRNSSPVRLKNRDAIDGRPHAYMRKFWMSRLNFRKLAHAGQIPGVKKASW